MMVKYQIEQFLQEAMALPPISQTVKKALSLIQDPETDAADLARILSTDQVMSAQILRWSNSACYGMKSQIMTVQQAVVVLGMDTIREMMMTCSVSDHLNQALPGYRLERGELWQHALGTAVGAQLISKKQRLHMDEEAYFGGLLCDIGKLVFEKHLREIDLDALEWEHLPFVDVERACFGIDHARLGAELAHHWQLPENLTAAIAFHHEPHAACTHKTLTATIHIADMTMKVLGTGIGVDGLRYPIDDEALQILNLTWEDLFTFSEQVNDQLEHAKESIYFN